ncbi:MAG: cyclophilin-like fold protein [Desulfobacterales bacterium]
MEQITISVEGLSLSAELNDSETAQKISEALPIEGTVNIWGEEIYFDIPVYADQASDAREEIEVGTLAYWPAGSALCIFFGRTPVSTGEKPRAYSPVNIVGHVSDDVEPLKSVSNGSTIRIAGLKDIN